MKTHHCDENYFLMEMMNCDEISAIWRKTHILDKHNLSDLISSFWWDIIILMKYYHCDKISLLWWKSISWKKILHCNESSSLWPNFWFWKWLIEVKIAKLRQSCDSFCLQQLQMTTFVCNNCKWQLLYATIENDIFCMHYCNWQLLYAIL